MKPIHYILDMKLVQGIGLILLFVGLGWLCISTCNKPTPTVNPLEAENDSLRIAVWANELIAKQHEAKADKLAARYDSLVHAARPYIIRYLQAHEELRDSSYDALYRFMGTLPDTSITR